MCSCNFFIFFFIFSLRGSSPDSDGQLHAVFVPPGFQVHDVASSPLTAQQTAFQMHFIPETAFTSNYFQRVEKNERCNDGPQARMTKGFPKAGFSECRDLCVIDQTCAFFAYWSKGKGKGLCETYLSCDTTVPDGDSTILLFARLDECEYESGDGSDGPYPKKISKLFPSNIVRTEPPRNIHCACMTRQLMLCVIFVVPGSPEEEAVNAKLNRNDPRNLAPFMIVTHGPLYPGPGYIPPIAVEFPDSRRNMDVYAEMHVADYSRCIHISICTTLGDMCPVSGMIFEPGDAVYIRSQDMALVAKGEPVICASTGLRQLANRDGLVKDPFSDDFKMKNFEESFKLFFIFSDVQISKGICGDKMPSMVKSPKSPESSPEAGSPGKSKRKRNRKKKKSGGAERSSGSPDLADIDEEPFEGGGAGPSGSGGGEHKNEGPRKLPSPPPTVAGNLDYFTAGGSRERSRAGTPGEVVSEDLMQEGPIPKRQGSPSSAKSFKAEKEGAERSQSPSWEPNDEPPLVSPSSSGAAVLDAMANLAIQERGRSPVRDGSAQRERSPSWEPNDAAANVEQQTLSSGQAKALPQFEMERDLQPQSGGESGPTSDARGASNPLSPNSKQEAQRLRRKKKRGQPPKSFLAHTENAGPSTQASAPSSEDISIPTAPEPLLQPPEESEKQERWTDAGQFEIPPEIPPELLKELEKEGYEVGPSRPQQPWHVSAGKKKGRKQPSRGDSPQIQSVLSPPSSSDGGYLPASSSSQTLSSWADQTDAEPPPSPAHPMRFQGTAPGKAPASSSSGALLSPIPASPNASGDPKEAPSEDPSEWQQSKSSKKKDRRKGKGPTQVLRVAQNKPTNDAAGSDSAASTASQRAPHASAEKLNFSAGSPTSPFTDADFPGLGGRTSFSSGYASAGSPAKKIGLKEQEVPLRPQAVWNQRSTGFKASRREYLQKPLLQSQ